jgi:hypothetical protein
MTAAGVFGLATISSTRSRILSWSSEQPVGGCFGDAGLGRGLADAVAGDAGVDEAALVSHWLSFLSAAVSLIRRAFVETMGLEPTTPCLQSRTRQIRDGRSCAKPHVTIGFG